ncbi:TnsD family transposase [Oceanobacillus oncorhynchi]|uniref:TnsD family transposase n=1 Tax=Oceanobacillus oncorhynchi TaxID=545501 RepID=UPI0034D714C0
MLFFPTAYPDELLFSLCSRYFIRSGNISYKGTLDDLFSHSGLTTSISLPTGVSSLIKNLPPYSKINERQIIHNHTLYLFYTAFLPPDRAVRVYDAMCSNDGKGVYNQSGLVANRVPQNEYLRFCRDCLTEDKEKYGEYYWHRSHQLSGIQCCLTHFKPLYNSSVRVVGANKHRLQIPTLESCSAVKSALDETSDKTQREYIDFCEKMAGSVLQLLNQQFSHREMEDFHQIYQSRLIGLGLAYYSGRVKQKAWREYFSSIYSQELLQLCHSELSGHQDWLSLIVQKNRKSFHPMRHLLVMAALDMNITSFFDENNTPKPFGNPSWPCLNKVCNYYRKPIINNVSVSLTDVAKEPVGTFTCTVCGFSYTRRGPDKGEEDRLRKTRVKVYGDVWTKKLKDLSNTGIGLRELGRQMGADPKTVKRYLENEIEARSTNSLISLEADRKKWLSLQKKFPNKSVKQLRKEDKALYMRLYRNDREWMIENSSKGKHRKSSARIDWSKRDEKMLMEISNVVEGLLDSEKKPVRLTVSKVGQLIGKKSFLEKNLNKMPKTMAYLMRKVETVEQFQARRIFNTIKQLKEQEEELVPWKIMRKAGIKDYGKWVEFVEHHIN